MNPIVVTGLGVVSALGVGAAHWDQVDAGASMASRCGTADTPAGRTAPVPPFQATDFMERKGLKHLNQAILFARTAARLALIDASLSDDRIDASRMAVVLGTNGSGTGQMLQFEYSAVSGMADPLVFPNTGLSAPACQISIFQGYHSQTSTLSSGRAAGLEAIAAAARVLREDEADIAIAGGVEELYPRVARLGAERAAAVADAAWPGPFFGAGEIRGEGCACVILERQAHALARHAHVLAVIGGAASGFDPHARRDGPDVASMTEVMAQAIRASGTTPEQIDAVISGAQGTSHDHAEAAALCALFGARQVPVVSLAAQLGNCDGAMGALQLVTAVAAIRDGKLSGYAPREHPLLDLVDGTRQLTVSRCLVTTFGSTGERTAMVVTAPANTLR